MHVSRAFAPADRGKDHSGTSPYDRPERLVKLYHRGISCRVGDDDQSVFICIHNACNQRYCSMRSAEALEGIFNERILAKLQVFDDSPVYYVVPKVQFWFRNWYIDGSDLSKCNSNIFSWKKKCLPAHTKSSQNQAFVLLPNLLLVEEYPTFFTFHHGPPAFCRPKCHLFTQFCQYLLIEFVGRCVDQ